jgi:hypothetical protein
MASVLELYMLSRLRIALKLINDHALSWLHPLITVEDKENEYSTRILEMKDSTGDAAQGSGSLSIMTS